MTLFLALVILVATPMLLAGGFQLSVETPPSPNDPEFRNAVLVVRTFGCHQTTDAAVYATAEGLVKGQRRTVKLEPKPTSKGVYTITRAWPTEGVWLIAVRGHYMGSHSCVLVELGPNGDVGKQPGPRDFQSKPVPRRLSQLEVDAALRVLAARLAASQQAAK
jgi:hypothetical protein